MSKQDDKSMKRKEIDEQKPLNRGVIYIFTNPSFKEYVKIGYARNVEERLRQLNRSESVPFAFRAYAVYEVDTALRDKELHRLIDRLNPGIRAIEKFDGRTRTKEFFALTKEEAYELLECIAKISGTEKRLRKVRPTGKEIADEKVADEIETEARRGPFRFSMCQIPVGSEICFTGDPSITAIVVDDRKIRYGKELTSLSGLASKLTGRAAVPGPMFFTYQGKVLADIRKEKEGIDK